VAVVERVDGRLEPPLGRIMSTVAYRLSGTLATFAS
jgi:hypothetical protein